MDTAAGDRSKLLQAALEERPLLFGDRCLRLRGQRDLREVAGGIVRREPGAHLSCCPATQPDLWAQLIDLYTLKLSSCLGLRSDCSLTGELPKLSLLEAIMLFHPNSTHSPPSPRLSPAVKLFWRYGRAA